MNIRSISWTIASIALVVIAVSARAENDSSSDITEGADVLPRLKWTPSSKVIGESVTKPTWKPKAANTDQGDMFTTTFQPGAIYRTQMPRQLIAKDHVFSFQFTGMLDDDPAKGTTFTVDGITFGYQPFQPKPGQKPLSMLVFRDPTADGSRWIPLKTVIAPGRTGMVHGTRISVAFHRKESTCDIYIHNVLVEKGIAMPSVREDMGCFVISPGSSKETVQIIGLQQGRNPISRVKFPVNDEGKLKLKTQ